MSIKVKHSPYKQARAIDKKEKRAWIKKSADISLKILEALDAIHITQVELANSLNVSRQHVSKIIKGKENLTLETIARIEEALEVTLISVPEKVYDPETKQRTKILKSLAYPQEKNSQGFKNQNKIKPIIYHSFEEKNRLEKDLMTTIPKTKRKAMARSSMHSMN